MALLYGWSPSCCPGVVPSLLSRNYAKTKYTVLLFFWTPCIRSTLCVNAPYFTRKPIADAKVSARQQCVYEDPNRRNLQQICNWWLIVTVAALLTVCELQDIFGCRGWKSPFSPTIYVIVDPLAEERPAIYQRNLCIADSTGLSSFGLPLLPLKSAKSREIPRKFELVALQGHPRSSILLPIESAYASSY